VLLSVRYAGAWWGRGGADLGNERRKQDGEETEAETTSKNKRKESTTGVTGETSGCQVLSQGISLFPQRVAVWAESSHTIASGHFGGRKGMGTKDAMYWFDRWVKQKWSEGKIVASLFLDVKSAYPLVNPARMVACLINKGCPLYICRIIQAFLDN
jgi:hypothetical protein